MLNITNFQEIWDTITHQNLRIIGTEKEEETQVKDTEIILMKITEVDFLILKRKVSINVKNHTKS